MPFGTHSALTVQKKRQSPSARVLQSRGLLRCPWQFARVRLGEWQAPYCQLLRQCVLLLIGLGGGRGPRRLGMGLTLHRVVPTGSYRKDESLFFPDAFVVVFLLLLDCWIFRCHFLFLIFCACVTCICESRLLTSCMGVSSSAGEVTVAIDSAVGSEAWVGKLSAASPLLTETGRTG